MKMYNVWIEIEEIDDETGEITDLSRTGVVDPIKMGEFASLDKALEAAYLHEYEYMDEKLFAGADNSYRFEK